MDKLDILVFIVIILTIIGLLFFFKHDVIVKDISSIFNRTNLFSRNKEDFTSGSYDLSDFDVLIGKNLFIGYDSVIDSDKQKEMLEEAAANKFKDKLNIVDLKKGNIFIKGGRDKHINKLCLGGGTEALCVDSNKLTNLDVNERPIPVFKKNDTPVYYNHDQPNVRHDKLCFKEGSSEKCIKAKHLNMINGQNAVKLKMQRGSNFDYLKPYNLEFATQNGFANVVVHPFYMTDSDYRTANPLVEGIETCYGDGGRQNHYLNDDNPTVSDSYYLTPEVIALSNYSHIHEHSHEDE